MRTRIKSYLIEEFMEDNNLTVTQFCKKCNISLNTYKKFLSNPKNGDTIRTNIIVKVAHTIGLHFSDLAE